ncbi:MFS transporter [Pseudolysinimonas yzui]|uniref:MFS transporter n=1 Tax=Pseudolysinimonas yzui TaxID=2708254 RepID=A0A8J3GRS5_9MICO|nr:MFS transporter [Pseudolysinimonas yzui]GHF20281.1 MFS transporter [Pseudolysinimonas yzui]
MKFGAFRARWYKSYLTGGSLLMAGDNAEHAITYLVMWQLFESPLLAGFAVVSHWLPHLLFSIPFGTLADRFDCRRIIQISLGLFVVASLTWGVLLLNEALQPWHCVVLLVVHGFASALWHPANQVMLYDMVGEKDLPSAVRLMATGLSLGMLVGPAAGAALLFTIGPAWGMFVNTLFYVPFLIHLTLSPFDGHQRRAAGVIPRVRLRELLATIRDLPRFPNILLVIVLQGAVGLLIGVALMPLLPEFGELLGQVESGLGYGLLLVAMSVGAVSGGLLLESVGRLRATPLVSALSELVFAACVLGFALSRVFPLSLALLVVAGAASILSLSTSQTVVQLEAPPEQRGRFVGAFNTTNMGFRVGSGVLLAILGGLVGIPTAVALAAGTLVLVCIALAAVAARLRAAHPPV